MTVFIVEVELTLKRVGKFRVPLYKKRFCHIECEHDGQVLSLAEIDAVAKNVANTLLSINDRIEGKSNDSPRL
jgi:hypothetical protein